MLQNSPLLTVVAHKEVVPVEMVPDPHLDYATLAPLLIVCGGAFIAVMLDALLKRQWRAPVQLAVTLLTLALTLVALVANGVQERFSLVGNDLLSMDASSYLAQGLLVIFTALSLMLMSSRHSAAVVPSQEERSEFSEIYSITLFSLLGMMLFVSSTNLLMLFVALEIMSLPLYVLTGIARFQRRQSREASLKYFLLGVLAGSVMLYGIVFLYAATGSFSLRAVADQSANGHNSLLILGTVFLLIGLLFKIGAVPFHSWVPDVYQGAPTPVTAFMAICTKLAAVIALARLLFVAMPVNRTQWEYVMIVLAIVSMVFGALLTMTQKDVKRLIAYSSITHAGFILVALVGAHRGLLTVAGLSFTVQSAVMVYLAAYGLATVGAFAIVTLVRNATGQELTAISDWAGLGRRHPWLGTAFALYFFSFAGFPLTAGFIGKFTVFTVPWLTGYSWLVVVALLLSALAAYAYVRMVIVLFFGHSDDDTPSTVSIARPTPMVAIVIVLTALGTLLLGVLPSPLLDLLDSAGTFLF